MKTYIGDLALSTSWKTIKWFILEKEGESF